MSTEPKQVDFTPVEAPSLQELPQGVESFLTAHQATFEAVAELFAPYVSQHAGIARNFEQVMAKLREAGFWVNDSVNMIMSKTASAEGKEQENAPEA